MTEDEPDGTRGGPTASVAGEAALPNGTYEAPERDLALRVIPRRSTRPATSASSPYAVSTEREDGRRLPDD